MQTCPRCGTFIPPDHRLDPTKDIVKVTHKISKDSYVLTSTTAPDINYNNAFKNKGNKG
jgi:hypothetical protein